MNLEQAVDYSLMKTEHLSILNPAAVTNIAGLALPYFTTRYYYFTTVSLRARRADNFWRSPASVACAVSMRSRSARI